MFRIMDGAYSLEKPLSLLFFLAELLKDNEFEVIFSSKYLGHY